MIKHRFQWRDLSLLSHGISPNPSDLPHVDLTIRDNVGPSRRKVTRHTAAYAINRLAHINGNIVEVAQRVYADGIGQLLDSVSSEAKVSSQRVSECSNIYRRRSSSRLDSNPYVSDQRFKEILGQVSHNRNGNAVACQMVCLVVVLRKNVVVGQTHEPRCFPR